ncbi:MAG: hypothetical protein ACXAC7_03355 [Candidatus Hodarchaeales archaeon]|jgi:hypothetical protein
MSSPSQEVSEETDNASDLIKPPELQYGLKETLRAIRFEFNAVYAELKFALRKLFRELKFLLRLFDLLILFILLGIGIVTLFIFTVLIVPGIISVAPESVVGDVQQTVWGPVNCYDPAATPLNSPDNCKNPLASSRSGWPLSRGFDTDGSPMFSGLSTWIMNLWLSDTTIRVLIGGAGLLGILIRLLFKSEIDKFRDKVNARSEVTYVFGSTIYAEKLLEKLVYEFAYEDSSALISDAKYLWVEKIAGLLDTYVVEDSREFGKANLYNIIGFTNAKRVFILTDDIECNQNILTNLRSIRPEVPIYILSQYTPQYLKTDELVKDENLNIIDDVANTREALVKSLSLNINFPDTTEINVPGNYVGLVATRMTKDLLGLDVLAVKRPNIEIVGDKGWSLLSPEDTILQRTDRVILHVSWDFGMKRTNRVVTESPVRHLVDLGELKIEQSPGKYITAKVTDAPDRTLYVEPKGSRKSWRRRILALISFIVLVFGLFLGRSPESNPYPGIPLDFISFFSALIGLLIAKWLHPLPKRGIMTWSKDEKNFQKRTKSFSKFGNDFIFSFGKAKEIQVVVREFSRSRLSIRRKKKSLHQYYFLDQDNNQIPSVNILVSDEKSQIVVNRFENRLQVYTGLEINIHLDTAEEPVEEYDESLPTDMIDDLNNQNQVENDKEIEKNLSTDPENNQNREGN